MKSIKIRMKQPSSFSTERRENWIVQITRYLIRASKTAIIYGYQSFTNDLICTVRRNISKIMLIHGSLIRIDETSGNDEKSRENRCVRGANTLVKREES